MTNKLALVLGLLLAAFGLGDYVLNDGRMLLFLAKKFVGLMYYVEFWRH